jgi:hypothetical protein
MKKCYIEGCPVSFLRHVTNRFLHEFLRLIQNQTSVGSVQVRKGKNQRGIIQEGPPGFFLPHVTPTDSSMSSDAQNQTSVGSVQVRKGKNHGEIIHRGMSRVLPTSRHPHRFLFFFLYFPREAAHQQQLGHQHSFKDFLQIPP